MIHRAAYPVPLVLFAETDYLNTRNLRLESEQRHINQIDPDIERRPFMRGFIRLAIIVLILVFLGWISFSNNENEATISIDKEKVKQDVEKIKQTGKKLADQVEQRAPAGATE